MEWLTEALKGITDESVRTAVEEGVKKGLGIHFIPKDKFNAVNEELKAQKDQATKSEATILELTGKAKTAEEKDAIIAQMKIDNETFKKDTDKRILNTTKSALLQMSLSSEVDASAVDLIAGLFDLDKLEIKEGKLSNYDDMVKPIKEARTSLFKATSTKSNGNPADRQNNIDPTTTMTDAEYYASIKTPKLT